MHVSSMLGTKSAQAALSQEEKGKIELKHHYDYLQKKEHEEKSLVPGPGHYYTESTASKPKPHQQQSSIDAKRLKSMTALTNLRNMQKNAESEGIYSAKGAQRQHLIAQNSMLNRRTPNSIPSGTLSLSVQSGANSIIGPGHYDQHSGTISEKLELLNRQNSSESDRKHNFTSSFAPQGNPNGSNKEKLKSLEMRIRAQLDKINSASTPGPGLYNTSQNSIENQLQKKTPFGVQQRAKN